ncbi:hypothetical protein Q1695_014064 [Nippostrongylus brasiliensis]|nr:hypothetical protein Q1695_014064 [Nippostrongylus brasiliensis]
MSRLAFFVLLTLPFTTLSRRPKLKYSKDYCLLQIFYENESGWSDAYEFPRVDPPRNRVPNGNCVIAFKTWWAWTGYHYRCEDGVWREDSCMRRLKTRRKCDENGKNCTNQP